MAGEVAFIGFGEAGQAFAQPGARAYDRKTDDPATRDAKLADYRTAGVEGSLSAQDALAKARAVLSLVTADQAHMVARTNAPLICKDALWLDMNSVAPGTKRSAAAAIEGVGGRYVDVAVMAPVLPARIGVPLLVAGPHAEAGAEALRALGFASVTVSGSRVGEASAIKMIRSVMVKGIEALTAECMMAAQRAGVIVPVVASLDASWKPQGWGARADYNLDRMLVHGVRRAAEMREVARTLDELGVEPAMTNGTIRLQEALGTLGIAPPGGLGAKLAAIDCEEKDEAA